MGYDMMDYEKYKVEVEKQQKVDAIIMKLQSNSDDQIKDFARSQVEHRYPFPAYRAPRLDENPRHHASFVAARLRLIWAMRRWGSELLDPADPYAHYLRG